MQVSFAENQKASQALTGMYVNQENKKAPAIEFKENGVFLLHSNEELLLTARTK